jgi:protein-L-isoaspartate(D-aspartate) O-methyltransferase
MTSFFDKARSNMIHGQLKPAGVNDLSVLDAFRRTPRHLFLPKDMLALAYSDEAVPLPGGAFVMPPVMLGRILTRLAVSSRDNVLFLGGGYGYEAAVTARLAASVIVLEEEGARCSTMHQRFYDLGVRNAFILNSADYLKGHEAGAPYDAVVMNSVCPQDYPPDALAPQAATGARLVYFRRGTPSLSVMAFLRKDKDGALALDAEERCLSDGLRFG